MRVKFVLFFLFIGMCSVVGQEERLPWQEARKLTWDDYKKAPESDSHYAAITSSGIWYSMSGEIVNGEVSVRSDIVCYFYPRNSWYKYDLASPNLLAHEQLHFDITELHARILRQKVAAFNFTKDAQAEMKQLYNEVTAQLKEYQDQYDTETNYSMNKEKQQEWQEKVKKELEKF